MSKQSKLICILAVMLLFSATSCFEKEVPEPVDDKLYASVEDGAGFQAGESFAVFSSLYREEYRSAGKRGSETILARFSEAIEGGVQFDRHYVYYPYSTSVGCSREGQLSVTLPSTIEYGKEARYLAGSSPSKTENSITLKSICGILDIRIKGTDSVKELHLSAAGQQGLAGAAGIGLQGSSPLLTMSSVSEKVLKMTCGKGVGLNEDGKDFLFPVPPGNYPEGFYVEIVDSEGETYPMQIEDISSIERGKTSTAVIEGMSHGTGTDITSFGVTLPDGRWADAVDTDGPVITLCVPRGTDITALKPKFTSNGNKVTVNGKSQVSGKTEVNFTKDAVYTVSSRNGESKKYTVHVLDVDIPVVFVSTPGHAEVVNKTDWHLGSRAIILNKDWNYTDYGSSGIKGRGNSSWNFKKKPYALKFETRPQKQEPPIETVLGMPGHKRWVLLSNYMCYDFGNQLGYEAGRRSGFAWSPRSRYVELVLNGEHKGMYSMVEQVRVDKNRVNIKEMDAEDITPEKITGGYLLNYDTTMDETYRFRSDWYNMPVMVKSPDEDDMTPEQFQYIKNYINTMEASLKDDERFAAREYLNYLDIDTFISAWFTKELASRKNNSSGTASDFLTPRSVFYYKDRGGVLKAGPAWDMDVHFLKHVDKLYCTGCQYYGRLFEDPLFVKRVVEMWPQFKSNLLGNENYKPITAHVDSLYESCAYAAERDARMWKSIWTSFEWLDIPVQRDRAKEMLQARITFMDREIAAMAETIR